MVQQTVQYGEDKIRYQVFLVPGRKGKVAIHVHPDGSVQVDAPLDTEVSRVKGAVLKRAGWVLKHMDQARRQRELALSREYVSGESHFYLGRRYQLKIVPINNSPQQVKLVRGRFQVETSETSAEVVKALLSGWYREHARRYFQRRLIAWCEELAWVKDQPPWQLRIMTKQWGSCSPKGRLTLNPHLIKAPRNCIDYVLLHELCHLREHNHSRRFYELLDRHLPEWRSIKARLDGMAEMLLVE